MQLPRSRTFLELELQTESEGRTHHTGRNPGKTRNKAGNAPPAQSVRFLIRFFSWSHIGNGGRLLVDSFALYFDSRGSILDYAFDGWRHFVEGDCEERGGVDDESMIDCGPAGLP